jgi:hypothetical protein
MMLPCALHMIAGMVALCMAYHVMRLVYDRLFFCAALSTQAEQSFTLPRDKADLTTLLIIPDLVPLDGTEHRAADRQLDQR